VRTSRINFFRRPVCRLQILFWFCGQGVFLDLPGLGRSSENTNGQLARAGVFTVLSGSFNPFTTPEQIESGGGALPWSYLGSCLFYEALMPSDLQFPGSSFFRETLTKLSSESRVMFVGPRKKYLFRLAFAARGYGPWYRSAKLLVSVSLNFNDFDDEISFVQSRRQLMTSLSPDFIEALTHACNSNEGFFLCFSGGCDASPAAGPNECQF